MAFGIASESQGKYASSTIVANITMMNGVIGENRRRVSTFAVRYFPVQFGGVDRARRVSWDKWE